MRIENPKPGTRVSFEEFDQYAMLHIMHLDARYAWYTSQSWNNFNNISKEVFEIIPNEEMYPGYNLGPEPEKRMRIEIPDMSNRYHTQAFYSRDKESEYFVFLTKDAYAATPLKAEEREYDTL